MPVVLSAVLNFVEDKLNRRRIAGALQPRFGAVFNKIQPAIDTKAKIAYFIWTMSARGFWKYPKVEFNPVM